MKNSILSFPSLIGGTLLASSSSVPSHQNRRYSSSIIGKRDSEYYPLFAIHPLMSSSNNRMLALYSPNSKFKEWSNNVPQMLSTLVRNKLRIVEESTSGLTTEKELSLFVETLENLLITRIENTPELNSPVRNLDFTGGGHIDSYRVLQSRLLSQGHSSRMGIFDFTTSAQSLKIGLGLILDSRVNSGLYKPLSILAVKREYIPYLLMCQLLDEDPDPRIFKLFESTDLDIPKGEYKLLRTRYRRDYKKPLVEAGVEVVTLENIYTEFYQGQSMPSSANTISKKKQWVLDTIKEVSEHYTIVRNLRRENVTLEL